MGKHTETANKVLCIKDYLNAHRTPDSITVISQALSLALPLRISNILQKAQHARVDHLLLKSCEIEVPCYQVSAQSFKARSFDLVTQETA